MSELLTVSKETGLEAYNYAKKRLDFEYDRFHLPTSKQRLSMITMGTIGQLVFKKYLDDQNIQFDFQLQYGQYDDYDFILNEKIVEIKSSGYKNQNEWRNLNLIYNASQLEHAINKKYFCSVQMFLNGYDKVTPTFEYQKCDTAIISGWLEIDVIAKSRPTKLRFGEAYLIPLNELKAIDLLIKRQ